MAKKVMLNPERAAAMTALTASALLAAAGLLAYANSFSVPLIFDDWVTILHNPKLRQVWPIWSALSPPEDTGVGGRPIANLSFVLNYAISGESVRGFHVGNLAIHFLAGLSLFGVVRRTLILPRWRGRFGEAAGSLALAAAAIWMLQPVQTQSVTYVSQRAESLMGLFYFLTLYGSIRAMESGAPHRWQVVAVLSCFAGMATKEGMVTAPALVLLYDYVFVTGSLVEAWRRRWKFHLALASSWFLLATLMGGVHGRGVGFGHGMSWWTYLLIESRAVALYFWLTLWPAPLVFDYGTDLGTPGLVEAACAMGLLALASLTLYALVRYPAVGFVGAWFFITLAPTSSFVPIPLQPISENRIYVPTAAVLTGLVMLVHHFSGRGAVRALAGAAVAFAALTAARNRDYRSEIAIWADTVAKRPTSSRAHSNLGHALQSAGRLAEAKREHEIALQIRPDYSEAHANLAAVVGQLGLLNQAIEHSRRAAKIDPRNANAFYNLGVALTQKGDIAGAIQAYQSALAVRHDSADTHANLALLLLRVGRAPEAIAHSESALRIKPAHPDASYALATGLVMSGRPAEAVPLFQDVVRVRPNHADAYQNMGTALQQIGRIQEAVSSYEAALRLNPNHVGARFNLANTLLNAGRAADAIPQYEAVLQLSPNAADAHLNLGIALAQTGRTDDAIARLNAALQLEPNSAAAREQLEKLRAMKP